MYFTNEGRWDIEFYLLISTGSLELVKSYVTFQTGVCPQNKIIVDVEFRFVCVNFHAIKVITNGGNFGVHEQKKSFLRTVFKFVTSFYNFIEVDVCADLSFSWRVGFVFFVDS